MTFKQLQDEVILLRFNEGKRASVKSWLNLRYTGIWNMADWYFKHVTGVPWTVPSGDQAPPMFSDFAKSEGLFDTNGQPLIYLPQREFEDTYLSNSGSGGPEAYTVVDRQIILAPVPSASTLYLSYRRRVSHVDVSGDTAAGTMLEDGDQPIWGAEFDYLLVLDAILLGAGIEADPTLKEIRAQRDELLETLKRDSLHSNQADELLVWGAGC